jgi:hypothetical protein
LDLLCNERLNGGRIGIASQALELLQELRNCFEISQERKAFVKKFNHQAIAFKLLICM